MYGKWESVRFWKKAMLPGHYLLDRMDNSPEKNDVFIYTNVYIFLFVNVYSDIGPQTIAWYILVGLQFCTEQMSLFS